MIRYIVRRLLQAIPLLLLISMILFVLMQTAGDPLATLGGRQPPRAEDRERLRRQLGLDQPVLTQYVYWLVGNDWVVVDAETGATGTRRGALRGDFGNSLVTRQPAMKVIAERMGNTLILMVTAEVLIVVVSLTVGIVSAVRQYSLLDTVLTTAAFVTYSIPVFLMALILMYIFAIKFRNWGLPYLPISGMFDPTIGPTPQQVIVHMILPVLTISLISIAGYSRYVRSTMLEVINSDYIRTARAKGLGVLAVLGHALRNAAVPIATTVGVGIALLIGGVVVTESVYAIPGLGRLTVDAVLARDFPTIQGLILLFSFVYVLINLLVDLSYVFFDPRIRY